MSRILLPGTLSDEVTKSAVNKNFEAWSVLNNAIEAANHGAAKSYDLLKRNKQRMKEWV